MEIRTKPAKIVSVHLFCDCGSEMQTSYRDKIFKLAPYLYECLDCNKRDYGYIMYPHPRFELEED